MYDVLCYGAICADLRMWLPRFPHAGEGVHVQAARWSAGGNAFNEARALRGLGADVRLFGDALGDDPAGRSLAAELNNQGLASDIQHLPSVATPVCHILITPDGQRTILALRDAPPPFVPPNPALLAAARLISVTRYGPHTSEFATAAAAAARPLLVADATRPADPLCAHADVIVTSAELLADHNPDQPIETQIAALHAVRNAAVIVTDGPRPVRMVYCADGEHIALSWQPEIRAAADTTGAGDVFRAGVAWGLLQQWPWQETIRFACDTAYTYIATHST